MHPLIRKQLFTTVLALGSACLAVFSTSRLFGELSATGPLKTMQQWSIDGKMGAHPVRQKQLSRLLMSIRVAPWSSDRRMDLARFYTWHLHRESRYSRKHQIYAQRTQQRILEALRWRPSWGFAWARLAENSVVSGNYDPVINRYLERALRYGPYELGTLQKVALMGMLHWQKFPQSMQGEILATVKRLLTIDDHPNNLIRLAFTLQWHEHILPLLQNPHQHSLYDAISRRLEP